MSGSLKTHSCIFCGTNDVKKTHAKTITRGIVFKIFSQAGTTSYSESIFDCPFCNKRYRGFIGMDKEVLKRRLHYSDVLLTDLVRLFPNIHRSTIIDSVINGVKGIGQLEKKGQKLRSKECDISFIIGTKRAYLHCKQEETVFKVVSVNEV